MLLAAETGSVSSGNRLSSFTFDDTQLLIFGFHWTGGCDNTVCLLKPSHQTFCISYSTDTCG